MSSKLLRKAAEILRERAEAARDVTGGSDWFVECRGVHFTGEYGVRSSGGFVAGDTVEEEAEFIATMHPGVGLALAVWLNHVATVTALGHPVAFADDAIALARLIVGDEQ